MALKAYQAIYERGTLVWADDNPPADQRLRVMVIVLDAIGATDDQTADEDWRALGQSRLREAYGDDEPEYSVKDIVNR